MALITRTVSINAAFLQEIKDDHHELRQLMHHAAAMLKRPIWMRPELDRLVDLLNKLRDQLAMHFSLEEAFGYFEDAVSAAPHLCKRADLLRSQHDQLYSQFCRLAETAEGLLYREANRDILASIATGYEQFSASFQEHEAHENELILEAFHSDLGAGD